MSLRVGWDFGSTLEDEGQDVVIQDPPCWTATNAVLKAGRELSSWLFSNLSPPSSPSISSFFCKDSSPPRQLVNAGCSTQSIVSHTSYSSLTPSYISILPQELLEEIFREYLHGPTATSPASSNPLTGSFRRIITTTGTKTTPFTLAHVCSSWRGIVMSNPSLWSRLCAFRPESHDIPLFEFWLSRSSGCLLDLTLVQRGEFGEEAVDETTYRLLVASLGHSERWRTVSLHLSQDMEGLFTTPPTPVPQHFPSLQDCRLDLVDWSIEGSRAISRMLSTSPRLESIAYGNMCRIPPIISEIPWAPLRDLRFAHIDIVDLYSILCATASLAHLSIHSLQVECHTLFPSFQQSAPPIQLPGLSSLSLTSYDDVSLLFDVLCLPSLSTLTLANGLPSIRGEPGWVALANMLLRSGSRLMSLNWTDNAITEETLIENFAKASNDIFFSLQHLNVRSPISRRTLEALAATPGANITILPSLRSLSARNCNADETCLAAMIISRPCLQKVDVKLRDGNGGTCGHLSWAVNTDNSLRPSYFRFV